MSRPIAKMMLSKKLFRSFSTNIKVPHVCIVGAGPAGFYAAMHLIKNLPQVKIDIFDKLPVPFGLIRYGVAPDHPEVKNVINQFTKVAQQQNVSFYGNIALGRDIQLADLRQHYNAVVLTYGAEEDKLLGIENEDAHNIVAARNFVGWYNGLPNNRELKIDLSGHTAAIIGQGNVALDVARILLTPIDDLKKTDITEHALSVLSESKVKELYLIGRRGPLQVAFTIKELREQLKLSNCKTLWKIQDFDGVEQIIQHLPRPRKRLTELMLKSLNESSSHAAPSESDKILKPIFYRSPHKFIVNDKRKLTGIELVCNKLEGKSLEFQKCIPTDEKEVLNCSLAFRSIGYQSVKVDKDLLFTNYGSVVNNGGRVGDTGNGDVANLYVAGWLGSGPAGVILHTMGNAFQVAKNICEDLRKTSSLNFKSGFKEVVKLLNKDQIVDWQGWEKINKHEIEQGKKLGKPREKICSIEEMINIAKM